MTQLIKSLKSLFEDKHPLTCLKKLRKKYSATELKTACQELSTEQKVKIKKWVEELNIKELINSEPLSIHSQSRQNYTQMTLNALEYFLSEDTEETFRQTVKVFGEDAIKTILKIESDKLTEEKKKIVLNWLKNTTI